MPEPKIVFMGTPEFAVPSMQALHRRFPLTAVVTTPDRERGRGRKKQFSEVKQAALELGLPEDRILQPEQLRDPEFVQAIQALQPDIIVVLAFRILPHSVYSAARLGAFNIHGSLLPKYRGAAPINWAIINGETETGLTAFLLADRVDTGNILMRESLPIPADATFGDMYYNMMPIAAGMTVTVCERLLREGTDIQAEAQDDAFATPAPKIFREDCRIDWSLKAETIRNFVRGVSPVPGAFTMLDDASFKIYRAELCGDNDVHLADGECLVTQRDILFGCGAGECLRALEVQVQGKKRMSADDYVRGYRGPARRMTESTTL